MDGGCAGGSEEGSQENLGGFSNNHVDFFLGCGFGFLFVLGVDALTALGIANEQSGKKIANFVRLPSPSS